MSQLWSENFDSSPNTVDSDAAYSNSSTSSISYFPSNWVKFSDVSALTNGMSVGNAWTGTQLGPANQTATWGGTKHDLDNRIRGWIIYYGGTPSGNSGSEVNRTGPLGGHNSSNNGHLSTGRHLGFEATSIGGSAYSSLSTRDRNLALIRTGAIDLTSQTSTDTLKLSGYYHANGTGIGAFGVACTTVTNSGGSANEAFTGSGFTGFTNDSGDGLGGGGCNISYAGNGSTSINVSNKKRIVGRQHTTQGENWKPFEVNLTGAGGQTVYLYFLYEAHNYYSYKWGTSTQFSNNYWRADFCIDTLSLDYIPPPDTDFIGKIFGVSGASIENIFGEDLDEGDKISNSTGEGIPDRVLDIEQAFDAPGTLSGNYFLLLRTGYMTWTTIDSGTLTSDDFTLTIPSTYTPFSGSGNNFALHFSNPAGDYTLSSITVTNTSPSNASFYTYSFGATQSVLGTWVTAGDTTLEIEWAG